MPGLMMPRRRGIFGSAIPQSPLATEAVQPAAQPQKPKFFGEGGTGRNIAGHLGDALLQMAKMDPIYQPQMQRQQEMRYLEQRDAAKRQLDMADFRTQQQIRSQYDKPHVNDTEADYAFWQSKLTPQQFETWKQNRIDPPQYRQGPDMQFYRINPTAPPQITEDDWNSAPVQGGPTQPASGGFR